MKGSRDAVSLLGGQLDPATIPAPVNGNVISWNGTLWVASGISGASLAWPLTVPNGLGGISQINGPTDQTTTFQAGAGQPIQIFGGAGAAGAGQQAGVVGGTGAAGFRGGQAFVGAGLPQGADLAGAAAFLLAGRGTGLGVPGFGQIQGSFPLATGSTLQTLYDRLHTGAVKSNLSLVSSTAQVFAKLSTIANSSIAALVLVNVEANDGTNWDSSVVAFLVVAVNKAGVITTGFFQLGTQTAVTSGTLAATATVGTTGTDVNLQVTPTWTVIAPTLVRASYAVMPLGPTQVTPQ